MLNQMCFSLAGTDAESSRDADHGQPDHPPAGGGGTLAFRDDKQETMVVRPYPQVQTHGQPQATPQTVPIQPGTPVTVPAPSVHLPQGQPAVLTEGQMKVMIYVCYFKKLYIHVNSKGCVNIVKSLAKIECILWLEDNTLLLTKVDLFIQKVSNHSWLL